MELSPTIRFIRVTSHISTVDGSLKKTPNRRRSDGKGLSHENAIRVSRSVADDLNESRGLQKSPADKRNHCSGYVQASKWEQGARLYWLCEESLSNESVNEPRRSFSFSSTAPFSDGFPVLPLILCPLPTFSRRTGQNFSPSSTYLLSLSLSLSLSLFLAHTCTREHTHSFALSVSFFYFFLFPSQYPFRDPILFPACEGTANTRISNWTAH